MSTEKNNIQLVKVTKEEKIAAREVDRKKKEEKWNRIPERDREKKRVYKNKIIKTLILFVAALGILGFMATGILSTTIALVALVVIAGVSTYIARKDQ